MADFWGAKAIAGRMGVSRTTLLGWIKTEAFLAYPRPTGRGWQRRLYTNDALIERWQIARCAAYQANKQRRRRTPRVNQR
jgi:hypothetical protein